MDLAGKVVVYIGAFGGIGRECVKEFLTKNLKALVVFDLTKDDELFKQWQTLSHPNTHLYYHQMNIVEKAEIAAAYKAAADEVGSFDVVVNGSGLMNDRKVELTIDINLSGVIQSTLVAISYMNKTKGGSGGLIVNISSVAGLQPTALFAIYSACKTGVTTFTRAMANPIYYEEHGVAFITICPGFTNTTLLDDVEEKSTFDFPTVMTSMFGKVKRQNADVCAQNLVKVVESAKNGAVYKLEFGEIEEVEFPILWRPVLE